MYFDHNIHHRKRLSWAWRPQCRISKRLNVVSDSHLGPLSIRPPRQLKCPNGAEAAFERENSDCKRTGRSSIVWKPCDLRLRSLGGSPHNAERRTWRPIWVSDSSRDTGTLCNCLWAPDRQKAMASINFYQSQRCLAFVPGRCDWYEMPTVRSAANSLYHEIFLMTM